MSTVTGQPVIVIGMYRGGTSSVAHALRNVGVFLGKDEALLAANEYNATGFFENESINIVNRATLQTLTWLARDHEPLPDYWEEAPSLAPHYRDLVNAIEKNYAGHELWGWKDPVTSVLMPMTITALGSFGVKPHFIICCRNPIEVMHSKYMHVPPGTQYRLGAWLRFTLGALRDSKDCTRAVVMHDEFLADPAGILKQALAPIEPALPKNVNWDKVRSAVRPELVHYKSNLDELAPYPDLIRRVYEFCRVLASDTPGLNSGKYNDQIEALASEFDCWYAMLREKKFAEFSAVSTRLGPGGPFFESAPFRPSGEWQTVRVAVPPRGGNQLMFGFGDFPGKVWIRKASWIYDDRETPATFVVGDCGHLSEQEGMHLLWTLPGPEQLICSLPPATPNAIEFEVMAELGIKSMFQSFKSLMDAYIACLRQLRSASGSPPFGRPR
ncbi:MAG: hypothetical protein ABUL49_01520 [bacterium]